MIKIYLLKLRLKKKHKTDPQIKLKQPGDIFTWNDLRVTCKYVVLLMLITFI